MVIYAPFRPSTALESMQRIYNVRLICTLMTDRGWGCVYLLFFVQICIQKNLSERVGVQGPMQARIEAAVNQMKDSLTKVKSSQLAFEAGLMDPEMIDRMIGFTNFLSTWLIRQVDPKKTHPNPSVE